MSVLSRVGLPGSGKSYTSVVEDIVPALRRGRKVVTNLPLDPHKLGLIHNLVEECSTNLVILTDDEMADSFWYDDQAEGVKGSHVGALVVYDEIQRAFNSKAWNENPRRKKMADWLSHHRHIGADLVWMSQSEALVDSCIRNMTEMQVFVQNVHLPFMNGRRRSRTYLVVDGKVLTDEVLKSEMVKLDPRFYSCYKSFEVGGSDQHARSGGIIPAAVRWRLLLLVPVLGVTVFLFATSKTDIFGQPKKTSQPKKPAEVVSVSHSSKPKFDDKRSLEYDGYFGMGDAEVLLLCGGDVVGSCERCSPWLGGSDSLSGVDSSRVGFWFRRVPVCNDGNSRPASGASSSAVPAVPGAGN